MVLLINLTELFLGLGFCLLAGFVGCEALKLDIREKPWKYREWLDADGAHRHSEKGQDVGGSALASDAF